MNPARSTAISVLLCVTALALILRLAALDAFPPSPDDGSYLFSAGVQDLSTQDVQSWPDADLAWVAQSKIYPHSYLHQWMIRWFHRAGADNLTSVRLDSAVLGSLTPLLLYCLYVGVFPKRRGTALVAAASLSALVMFCWYSRTGWGQAGCTFFWTLYLLIGYRLFHDCDQSGVWRRVGLGFGLAAAALAAYGYHEMIVVHVLGLGIYALLQVFWERKTPGQRASRWALLVYVLSGVPVAACAATLRTSQFASKHWFGLVPDAYAEGYWSYRWRVIGTFAEHRLDLQLGWIILLLAPVGAVAMRRRDPRAFRFFATIFVTSWAIFFFLFRDPYLVRIYLPTFVVVVIFASEGLAALHGYLHRYGPVLAHAVLASILIFYSIQSVSTLFGESGASFAVKEFYPGAQGEPNRDHMRPIVNHLRDHAKTSDSLGITDIYTPYFELEDEGIRSLMLVGKRREFVERKPDWIIGRIKDPESGEPGIGVGREYYELAVTDTLGSLGLFRRRR